MSTVAADGSADDTDLVFAPAPVTPEALITTPAENAASSRSMVFFATRFPRAVP